MSSSDPVPPVTPNLDPVPPTVAAAPPSTDADSTMQKGAQPAPQNSTAPSQAGRRWILPLLEVLVPAVLVGSQVYLMNRQNNLIERQVEIYDRQTALLERQTALSRAGISPRFVFSKDEDGFTITNKGEMVRGLTGRCVPFLELKAPEVKGKTIELHGYYESLDGLHYGSQSLYFFRSEFPLLKFLISLGYGGLDYNRREYVEISYIDLTGERRSEKYVIGDGANDLPVDRMPTMNARTDLSGFFKRNRQDVDGATKAIFAKADELKKRN